MKCAGAGGRVLGVELGDDLALVRGDRRRVERRRVELDLGRVDDGRRDRRVGRRVVGGDRRRRVRAASSSSLFPVINEITRIPPITTTAPIAEADRGGLAPLPLHRGLARFARLARALLLSWLACRPSARGGECSGSGPRIPSGGATGPPVPWSAVSLVVQKFGGTSVADPDRIRAVADHVVRTRRAGDDVVVVVSAMGKTTDDLDAPRPRRRRAARRPRDGHAAHRG